MEAPADVTIAIQGVRPTMRFVFNLTAKVASERSFDANGKARELTHEARWELWDTDVFGVDYRVCTLEAPGDGYLFPNMTFVEWIRLSDPARYDGDLSKMMEAMVDTHNEDLVSQMSENTFEELGRKLAEAYFDAKTPMVSYAGAYE